MAAVFLILQDTTGVAITLLLGAHPGYGLMAGSISFAGGHGTAIAWGAEAEAAGLTGASMVGIAFATFGLIGGGVMGGPIARYPISRNRIEARAGETSETDDTEADDDGRGGELFNIFLAMSLMSMKLWGLAGVAEAPHPNADLRAGTFALRSGPHRARSSAG